MPIEIKKSGGSWPINAVVPINDTADVRLKNGQTWLKSGVIETDTSLYPDAKISIGTFTGVLIDTSSVSTNAFSGIPYDGGFWVLVSAERTFYEFNPANGNQTGRTIDVPSINITNNFLTTDGSFIYLTSGTEDVYKIDLTGVVQTFDVSATLQSASGIVWDGQRFLINEENTSLIRSYNASFGYIEGITFDIRGDLAFDGSNYYVASTSGRLYQVDLQNNTILKEFSVDLVRADNSVFYYSDGFIYVINTAFDGFRQISDESYVGVPTAYTDSETSLPYYARIK